MENRKWLNFLPPEYKKQCVEMVLDGKHSVSQVCKMMRVSQSALNRWKQQFLAEQQGITPKAPAISAEQPEIQRLRAENEPLRSDNALLKKVLEKS
ncbi:transposase [Mannheimia pernigra]|uniref:Transposase n=2 Tax=Mannheimia TaxID=75984 RepID=A0ABD7A9G1_9PAST|nr:transposase [Mannheimia pernigra]QLB42658.1 transposase [Mannheimia pernigra]QTM02068.1 transposase [Mannheimia sp. ZY171111]